MVVQSDFVVSPIKWHLGHTTWLFEKFVLETLPGYKKHNQAYDLVFNSYYSSLGTLFDKNARGSLSRPTVDQVLTYRTYVDNALENLFEQDLSDEIWRIIELGIQHEKQHQELMLYDIKHIFWSNPLQPVYKPKPQTPSGEPTGMNWIALTGGVKSIGASLEQNSFAYDNEGPVHQVLLQDYSIASRNVTNEEYLQFVLEDGYAQATHWLSLGQQFVNQNKVTHPFYWKQIDGDWFEYGLHGLRPLQSNLPVTHISFYEADAYARWAGYRLPTEFEWENAANSYNQKSLSAADGQFEPTQELPEHGLLGLFIGNCWHHTASAYLPYPGYGFKNNGLGEYNGKFMSNQMVQRGGSCLTPIQHLRPSYRNFFEPDSRWQCSGIRLAV